jgi:hypothetical protein
MRIRSSRRKSRFKNGGVDGAEAKEANLCTRRSMKGKVNDDIGLTGTTG